MKYLDGYSDEKVILHYGFYCSLDTLQAFYGDEPIPNQDELVELVYPVIVKTRELSTKLRNLQLSKNEIGGIIGLIYYSQCKLTIVPWVYI